VSTLLTKMVCTVLDVCFGISVRGFSCEILSKDICDVSIRQRPNYMPSNGPRGARLSTLNLSAPCQYTLLDHRSFPLSLNRAIHSILQGTCNGLSFWSAYPISHNPQSLPLLCPWQSRRKEGDIREFVRATGATYVTFARCPHSTC
jgi:hypothetical protein